MAARQAGGVELSIMRPFAEVTIHASQFPSAVRQDLRESLRSRQVNHKFHYDSVKQTQKWLALHQKFSPSRNEPDCAATYDKAFVKAAQALSSNNVALVGLGCGGGQKDAGLLRQLQHAEKTACYMPVDVSTAMVLVARQTVLNAFSKMDCFPLVCDLGTTPDWRPLLDVLPAKWGGTPRLFTFFGMLPNFEPGLVIPRLAAMLNSQDLLLVSANLAPGDDYAAGVHRILPQYDNALTRDWLMTFLLDLGVEAQDGALSFNVGNSPTEPRLKQVIADFTFKRPREIHLEEDLFSFSPGDSLRLFFSYRYTPALLADLLKRHGLETKSSWVTNSGEEGVFLVQRG